MGERATNEKQSWRATGWPAEEQSSAGRSEEVLVGSWEDWVLPWNEESLPQRCRGPSDEFKRVTPVLCGKRSGSGQTLGGQLGGWVTTQERQAGSDGGPTKGPSHTGPTNSGRFLCVMGRMVRKQSGFRLGIWGRNS